MNTAHPDSPGPLLVLDGTLPSHTLLRSLCKYHSPIVAADGAALQLKEHRIRPDIIVGDLDTIQEHVSDPFFTDCIVAERPDQNDYDGAKALRWLVEERYDTVTILGSGGGMIDHVLNNFSLIARFGHMLSARLVFDDCIGYVTGSAIKLRTTPGERISLIPLPAATLTTRGLAWDLHDEELMFGRREGASNRATGEEISVQIRNGLVAVFHYERNEALETSDT